MRNKWGPAIDGYEEAWRVVVIGISALVIIVGVYLLLHVYSGAQSYDKENAAGFFETTGKIKATFLKLEVRQTDIDVVLKELDGLLTEPGNGAEGRRLKRDILTSEFLEGFSYLEGFITAFKDVEVGLKQNDLRVVEVREKIDAIAERAWGLSRNDGFFWITGYWRWLEIVFWGEFGVIVGILVWVGTQFEQGKYLKITFVREKLWYWTEVFIGPIVVVAVFFLLKYFVGSIMQGVTEDEVRGSIYLTLGISFTLGLYIRRSLGVFSYIKDKLKLPLPNSTKKKKEDK